MTNTSKYAISNKSIEILNLEGYVALRIVDHENIEEIKTCEAVLVKHGDPLPKGADLLYPQQEATNYGTILLISFEHIKGYKL